LADGTVIITAPTGHTYTTRPGSSLFFPAWAVPTPAPPLAPPPPCDPDTSAAHRALKVPLRKRTRTKSRADYIKAERALNDARIAARNEPAPF